MKFKIVLTFLYLTIFLVVIGCGVTKKVGLIPENRNSIGKASIDDRIAFINSQLEKLDSLACGIIDKSQLTVGNIISSNLDVFHCFSEKEPFDSTYSKIITNIFLAQDFEASTDYLYVLPYVTNIQSNTFFSACIELLQYDYKPSGEFGHIVHYPVCHYINKDILLPKIRYIDGLSPMVYFNEHTMKSLHDHSYVDHMNYYHQMKDLWETGRITLTFED